MTSKETILSPVLEKTSDKLMALKNKRGMRMLMWNLEIVAANSSLELDFSLSKVVQDMDTRLALGQKINSKDVELVIDTLTSTAFLEELVQ